MQHQTFQELASLSKTFERSLRNTGHGNNEDENNVDSDANDEQQNEEAIKTKKQIQIRVSIDSTSHD